MTKNTPLTLFRAVALLEALSWFALLFTMYLKYVEHQPGPNQVTGMAHGLLFLVYVMLVFQISSSQSWSARQVIIVLVASLIPGATIYVERRMLTEE